MIGYKLVGCSFILYEIRDYFRENDFGIDFGFVFYEDDVDDKIYCVCIVYFIEIGKYIV